MNEHVDFAVGKLRFRRKGAGVVARAVNCTVLKDALPSPWAGFVPVLRLAWTAVFTAIPVDAIFIAVTLSQIVTGAHSQTKGERPNTMTAHVNGSFLVKLTSPYTPRTKRFYFLSKASQKFIVRLSLASY